MPLPEIDTSTLPLADRIEAALTLPTQREFSNEEQIAFTNTCIELLYDALQGLRKLPS